MEAQAAPSKPPSIRPIRLIGPMRPIPSATAPPFRPQPLCLPRIFIIRHHAHRAWPVLAHRLHAHHAIAQLSKVPFKFLQSNSKRGKVVNVFAHETYFYLKKHQNPDAFLHELKRPTHHHAEDRLQRHRGDVSRDRRRQTRRLPHGARIRDPRQASATPPHAPPWSVSVWTASLSNGRSGSPTASQRSFIV